MIRELFLPTRIGSQQLFSERVVGISVENTSIRVAYIIRRRGSITIEKCTETNIASGEEKTLPKRTVEALKKVVSSIPKRVPVYVAYHASKTIIKELTLPFTDEEKIRTVIEYEVENVLPFDLSKALIDFIIVEKSSLKKSSRILVAAAPLDAISKFKSLFETAGISPQVINLDIFNLYGFYRTIPSYSKIRNDHVLVDVGAKETNILMLHGKELLFTRSIKKGYLSQEKPADTDDSLLLENLFEEIKFTLNSFNLKQKDTYPLEKITFICAHTKTADALISKCQKHIAVPCEKLQTHTLFSSKKFITQQKPSEGFWNLYSRALATALISPDLSHFTFLRKELAIPLKPIMQRMVLVTLVLTTIFFGSISGLGYYQINEAVSEIKKLESKEAAKIKKIFPKKSKAQKKKTLSILVKEGESYVKEQQSIWLPFSKKSLHPLEVIQELTNIINRKKFNVRIDEIIISNEDQAQSVPIEVRGFFSAQNGSDEHFGQFAQLEAEIESSKILQIIEEIDPIPADKGVEFTVQLKPREQ